MSAEMKNTLVESKLLRDGYRCVKHASGLTVFIYPKAEMRSTYAVFGTRYGSIDKAVSYTHLTLPTKLEV